MIRGENATDNTLLLRSGCPLMVSAINDLVLFSSNQFPVLFNKDSDLSDLVENVIAFIAEKPRTIDENVKNKISQHEESSDNSEDGAL